MKKSDVPIIAKQAYVLFDLDGTLINTDKANFLSYQEAVEKVKGIKIAPVYGGNVRFTREMLKKTISDLTEKEIERIVKIKESIFFKYIKNTSLNIYVVDFLKKVATTHPVILATKSRKERAEKLLRWYGLYDIFNNRFYRESYKNNEEKYSFIARVMNIDPVNMVIFENDYNEILQAFNAGVPHKNIFKVKGE